MFCFCMFYMKSLIKLYAWNRDQTAPWWCSTAQHNHTLHHTESVILFKTWKSVQVEIILLAEPNLSGQGQKTQTWMVRGLTLIKILILIFYLFIFLFERVLQSEWKNELFVIGFQQTFWLVLAGKTQMSPITSSCDNKPAGIIPAAWNRRS